MHCWRRGLLQLYRVLGEEQNGRGPGQSIYQDGLGLRASRVMLRFKIEVFLGFKPRSNALIVQPLKILPELLLLLPAKK